MTQQDVTFTNLYFAAADMAGNPAAVPLAWRPRAVERRAAVGIESIQFAPPVPETDDLLRYRGIAVRLG